MSGRPHVEINTGSWQTTWTGICTLTTSRLAEYGVAFAELRLADSTEGTSVKVAPSSRASSRTVSLSTMPAISRFSSHANSWADPCVPPALSLRGTWRWDLRGPASKEEEREEFFPSLVRLAADEGGSTKVSMTGCVPPTVAAGVGKLRPLVWTGTESPCPSRYLTDWGCSVPN